ncbi:MAG: hypothetical protein ACFFFC_00455 [Candidatus Thorarchaeota archaeon]
MQLDIPDTLIEKLLLQLGGLRENGGNEWDRTALGVFYSILIQETKGGKKRKNPARDAIKNRKKIRRKFHLG